MDPVSCVLPFLGGIVVGLLVALFVALMPPTEPVGRPGVGVGVNEAPVGERPPDPAPSQTPRLEDVRASADAPSGAEVLVEHDAHTPPQWHDLENHLLQTRVGKCPTCSVPPRTLAVFLIEAQRHGIDPEDETAETRVHDLYRALLNLYHVAESEVPHHPETRDAWRSAIEQAETVLFGTEHTDTPESENP